MKLKTFTKSLLTATAVLSTSAFIGCSDDVTKNEVENKDIKTKGDVVISITDIESGANLDSASALRVTRLGGDTTSATYENGVVTYKSLSIGTYSFKLEATGYASKTITTTVSLDAKDEVPVAKNVFIDEKMAKLGATLKGIVLEKNQDGNSSPVANQSVRLVFNAGFNYTTNEYAATTDSSGAYSFANLPVSSSYTLNFAARSDSNGVKTASSLGGTTTNYQSVSFAANATYNVNTSTFVLLNQNTNGDNAILATDPIVYKFNKSVDIQRSQLQSSKITVTSGGRTVPVIITWSANNTILTISPSTGSWFLGSVSVANVFNSLKSSEGKSFSGSIDRVVQVLQTGALAPVTAFSITNNGIQDTTLVSQSSNSLTLKFAPVANIKQMEVYKKQKNDSSFVLLSTQSISIEDSTIAFSTSGYFNDGESVSFALIPTNDEVKAVWADANAKALKDQYQYTATLSTTISSANLDNSGTTEPDTLSNYVQVSFNENMDTTTAPTVTLDNPDVASVTGEWINRTTYRAYPIIATNVDASGSTDKDIKVTITAVKDPAGNASKDNATFTSGAGEIAHF